MGEISHAISPSKYLASFIADEEEEEDDEQKFKFEIGEQVYFVSDDLVFPETVR